MSYLNIPDGSEGPRNENAMNILRWEKGAFYGAVAVLALSVVLNFLICANLLTVSESIRKIVSSYCSQQLKFKKKNFGNLRN